MSTEFTLPELGENVTSGDVVKVLVAAGDMVQRDQPVLELETDKATIEVPSSVEGKVADVKVKVGDKVEVGQLVLTVEGGESASAETRSPASAEKSRAQAEPQAQRGGSDTSGHGAREEPRGERGQDRKSRKEAGADDAASSERAQPEQRRAASDRIEAARGDEEPQPGRAHTPEGPDAESEDAEAPEAPRRGRGEVVDISRGARASAEAPAPAAEERPSAPAAPSVRRLARELGVDIHDVPGSGPGGRIAVEDVKNHARTLLGGGKTVSAARTAPALPDFTKWGEVERRGMSAVRRATAEHLGRAWAAIPHVTQHDRADVTDLERLRERFGPRAEERGGKLTVTAIALKIVAAALNAFPQFNASVDEAAQEIVYKRYTHIGVAVDTDRGLLVPVVRDVDRKGILELSVELAQLAEKARSRKLTLDEMQGGSFTITNLGGIGGTGFSPIVNWPEVAILGLSRARTEPVFVNGEFVPRLMLPLSLSYDHRLIDGADAIRFLRWVAEALEQPFLLSLHG